MPNLTWSDNPDNAPEPRRRHSATTRRLDSPLYASTWFLIFTLVPIAFMLALALAPALNGVALSFEHRGPSLANYRAVLTDRLFWTALGYNLLIPAGSLALELALGMGLALLFCKRGGPLSVAAEIAAIVPFALPEIVLLTIARYIFTPRGYLDGAMHAAGLGPLPWLIPGRHLAWATVTLVDAWHVTPIVMLVLIGGLHSIPAELYEAARMDGAGTWATFRYITLPMLAPAITAAIVLRGVDALRIFSTSLVLTGAEGVPVLSTYAYQLWSDAQAPHEAMAASVLLALLILAIALAGFLWTRRYPAIGRTQ